MRRILLIGASAVMALFFQIAHAGQILVIQAIGNYADSAAGGWHPAPDRSSEAYAKDAFTHTVMFDLDSCTLSSTDDGISGKCSRIQDIVKSPFYDFTSGWLTAAYTNDPAFSFAISKTGVNANNSAYYINKPRPEDWEFSVWAEWVGINLEGVWDTPINQISDLYNKKLRVKQMDQGNYNPNASHLYLSFEGTSPNYLILESGFEYAMISVIPEPSSIALMGVALAGLVFARRRKR